VSLRGAARAAPTGQVADCWGNRERLGRHRRGGCRSGRSATDRDRQRKPDDYRRNRHDDDAAGSATDGEGQPGHESGSPQGLLRPNARAVAGPPTDKRRYSLEMRRYSCPGMVNLDFGRLSLGEGHAEVALIVRFGFHRGPHRLPHLRGSTTPALRTIHGFAPVAGANHRPDWSGQGAGKSVEVGVRDYRCQCGSRHGSTWCDLRRRQFRRARTSRRSGSAAGHRADGHDDDTSTRAGDKRGEPDRDRDHAIGLRAGSRSVVAGNRRAGDPARPGGFAPLSLRPV